MIPWGCWGLMGNAVFRMERRSQVAIRKDFYAHISGKFPKEISEEKGLISMTVMTLVLGLTSYSKYTFITVHKNY